MTRAQIIALVAKRLGDESTSFQSVLDPFFDQVLADLAAEESMDLLRLEHAFDLVLDQETYSTRTMTGLTSPDYPLKVFRLSVPTWGASGIWDKIETDTPFLWDRQTFDSTATSQGLGRRVWQIYPNISTIRIWPPTNADASGAGLGRIEYLAPPTVIAGPTELAEIHREDIPTVAHGLVWYGAPFRDETLLDVDRSGQLYQAGKQRMWARTHNGSPGRTEPLDF